MISGLALVLMDKWALDPIPAYVAAWGVALAVTGLLGGLGYLIINGG